MSYILIKKNTKKHKNNNYNFSSMSFLVDRKKIPKQT